MDKQYTGFYIKAAHIWFRALDIETALREFEDWRDMNELGASDIGGKYPLYKMSASGIEKDQIGTVSYNGRVSISA